MMRAENHPRKPIPGEDYCHRCGISEYSFGVDGHPIEACIRHLRETLDTLLEYLEVKGNAA